MPLRYTVVLPAGTSTAARMGKVLPPGSLWRTTSLAEARPGAIRRASSGAVKRRMVDLPLFFVRLQCTHVISGDRVRIVVAEIAADVVDHVGDLHVIQPHRREIEF